MGASCSTSDKKKSNDRLSIVQETKKSTTTQTYDYLVLSGGGIKGIAYCGAVKWLYENDILSSNMKGYAGTSAGSIVAGLLAVGYDATELMKIMTEMDMKKICDDKIGIIRDTYNLIEYYGIAPGDYVMDFLGDLIEAKTGDKDYTIEQLYKNNDVRLVIVGTNMNTKASKYFHPEAPNVKDRTIPIRKAIRISMSIPFVFTPVEHCGHLYVDGGLLDNFPIHVFDGKAPGDSKNGECEVNQKVLGLQLLTAEDNKDIFDPDQSPDKIDSLFEYGVSFINTFMMENDRRYVTNSNRTRTVHIITPDFPLSKFDINPAEKMNLIEVGRLACKTFFENK